MNKYFVELETFVVYWVYIYNKRWEKLYFWLKVDDNTRQRIKESSFYWQRRLKYHYFRKKKLALAYFGRRIFSKSFGGKIRHIRTDVTYRSSVFKNGACVLQAPVFFLKVFRWENVLPQTALSKNWTHKIHELTTF